VNPERTPANQANLVVPWIIFFKFLEACRVQAPAQTS